MGQARGLFKIQYCLARRNLDKTRKIRESLSQGRDIRRMLKQHSLVMDGVRLGLRSSLTRSERTTLSRVWTCPALRCHQQSRDGSHS